MDVTHTHLAQIVKHNFLGQTSLDAHMWLEDQNGNVFDYDDETLKNISAYGTLKIVRKEFPKDLQKQLVPYILQIQENVRKNFGLDSLCLDSRPLLSQLFNTVPGHCFMRATMELKKMKKNNPKNQYKVKVGSLGFVQPDGHVFWEYG